MVRKIDNDTPTQVNSKKIGVQVISEEIASIVSGFTYDRCRLRRSYIDPVTGTSYGRIIITSDGHMYFYTLTNRSDLLPDSTRLYIWYEIGISTTTGPQFYTLVLPSGLTQESYIYSVEFDEETQQNVLVEVDTFSYMVDGVSDTTDPAAVYVEEDKVGYAGVVYELIQYPSEPVEGQVQETFLVDPDTGLIYDWIASVVSSDETVDLAPVEESTWEGKSEWSGTIFDGANFEYDISAWTDSDTPEVGDTVYFSTDSDWNENEVTDIYYDDPSCTVSYSVDGETWTDCDEVLTDYNNVINNIPRYMYLKFSQKVYITEE